LFVSAGEEYLTPLSPYFVIQDGEAVVKVITKKSSGRDVPIEFQAYGLRDSFRELQTIMHEVPIKIDISLTKDKIEASPESYSVLSVELKDRF
jgi:predicted trehalose synthase